MIYDIHQSISGPFSPLSVKFAVLFVILISGASDGTVLVVTGFPVVDNAMTFSVSGTFVVVFVNAVVVADVVLMLIVSFDGATFFSFIVDSVATTVEKK